MYSCFIPNPEALCLKGPPSAQGVCLWAVLSSKNYSRIMKIQSSFIFIIELILAIWGKQR